MVSNLKNPSMHTIDMARTRSIGPWSLTSKCDLDLWGTGLNIERDISSNNVRNLMYIIWKSFNAYESYGPDKKIRDGRTHIHQTAIVATKSSSPQAGSTKTMHTFITSVTFVLTMLSPINWYSLNYSPFYLNTIYFWQLFLLLCRMNMNLIASLRYRGTHIGGSVEYTV